MVPPQTGTPDVKPAPSGPLPVGGGGETKVKEGVPQVQRSIPQPVAAQGINTAGLNMLAAVGAMQQQERQQQQQQQVVVGTPQQTTAPKVIKCNCTIPCWGVSQGVLLQVVQYMTEVQLLEYCY